MFSKLALRNVRKSIKDYTIYFLTIAFGVCLFYMFNSLDSQAAMMKLNKSKYDCMTSLMTAISYISVFVAIILGFLIVYANGFLIKRRKKELGLYMTLGMGKGKIAGLLSVETLFIGVFALAVGLVAGVFASQGFSVVTAKLFESNLKSFQFVFSPEAFRKTLLYFGVMFLIVLLFNVFSVSHLKLIDLLTAGKKNQTFKAKKLWISVAAFLLSVACLATAYYLINNIGVFNINEKFTASIILGVVGTLLFFFSLSGFLLRIVQTNKKLYYKGLNMFILRQFNSKINTTFVSVSVICIMLLITIGTLSSGMGVANVLSQNMQKMMPYDVSLIYLEVEHKDAINMAKNMKRDGVDISKYAAGFAQADFHMLSNTTADFHFPESTVKDVAGDDATSIKDFNKQPLLAISLSQYNILAKLQSKPELTLAADEFAISCTSEKLKEPFNAFLSKNGTLAISGKTYKASQKSVVPVSLLVMEGTLNTVILPDKAVTDCPIDMQVLNLNYKAGITDEELSPILNRVYGNDADYQGNPPYDVKQSRQEIRNRNVRVSVIASYLAIYIGLVFLIAGAAVLALQQLSESSDNAERYALLRKLGTDERMMNHALFTQIGLYFLLPLSLAIVHSIVGIHVANKIILQLGQMDITGNSLITALIFLVVYGGYFLATFFGSRSILRQRNSD